jgi:intracellular sulfur oxidation DsrE/DsrF family protein
MLRRYFLSRLSATAGLLGAGAATVRASVPATNDWKPARHPQDDWFDALPGTHRVFFDTWLADRFEEAIGFARNYYRANKDGYGLTEHDLAVIVCCRHRTGPFAFNDAIWAKYGKTFAERQHFTDPKTGQAPVANVYASRIAELAGWGLHLAVCNMTTKAYAGILAEQTGASVDDVYKELTANTVAPAHFVPAGIVAVTRAQEHGYAIASVG